MSHQEKQAHQKDKAMNTKPLDRYFAREHASNEKVSLG
jgi:hypothetical protein